jgi:hypothetical protein
MLYIFRAVDMLTCIYYKIIKHEFFIIYCYHYIVEFPTCLGCLQPSSGRIFQTKQILISF